MLAPKTSKRSVLAPKPKVKAKAKKEQTPVSDSSDWGDDSSNSDSSDSDESSSDSDEDSSSDGLGGLEVGQALDLKAFNDRFDDHAVDDEEVDDDESDWVDEEDEQMAAQHGGNNQLEAVNNITYLQHRDSSHSQPSGPRHAASPSSSAHSIEAVREQ